MYKVGVNAGVQMAGNGVWTIWCVDCLMGVNVALLCFGPIITFHDMP